MSNNIEQNKQAVVIVRKMPVKKQNLSVEVKPDIAVKCNELPNTSSQIRFLAKAGYNIGQIASILGIRYQHAYNVTHQIVKNK